MENEQQQKQNAMKEFILNEASLGLLLAILTALTYVSAYNYDFGQKSFYHMPSIFVKVSSEKLIYGSLVTLLSSGLIFVIIGPVSRFFHRSKLGRWLVLIFVIVLSFFWYQEKITTGIALILFFLLVFAVTYPQPKEKMSFFIKIYLMIVLLLLVVFVPREIGKYESSRQDEYLVIMEKTPLIVIDTYGENVIVAPVDLKKGLITTKFKIMELKEINKELELKKTGRLKTDL